MATQLMVRGKVRVLATLRTSLGEVRPPRHPFGGTHGAVAPIGPERLTVDQEAASSNLVCAAKPLSSSGEDSGLSIRRPGFDSRRGHGGFRGPMAARHRTLTAPEDA